MQKLLFDLRFAIRQLARSRGFAITAVVMLAFGIGATTAIFSIVEAVLLRPLPFPDPERLVLLSDRLAGQNVGGSNEVGVTAPDIRTYTRETHEFTALGGYTGAGYELSGISEPAQVNAARLTAGVFSVLGVNPLLGRVFTADEDEHGQRVAVLSYATWVSRFHRDAQILGTKILLDRKLYIVIGVMPREFEFPLVPGQLNRAEFWVPMSFTEEELAPAHALLRDASDFGTGHRLRYAWRGGEAFALSPALRSGAGRIFLDIAGLCGLSPLGRAACGDWRIDCAGRSDRGE